MKRNTAKPSKLLQGLIGNKHQPIPENETFAGKRKAAFAGDRAALEWLLHLTPHTGARFELLQQFIAAGVGKELLCSLFVECLIDHPKGIQATTPGCRALLGSLFEFFGPVHITKPPLTITLYRAAAGVSPDVAASGFFWTSQLGYALAHAERPAPVLVSAEVPANEISAYYSPYLFQQQGLLDEIPALLGALPEMEAVLLNPPKSFQVLEIPAWHLERCQKTRDMSPIGEISQRQATA